MALLLDTCALIFIAERTANSKRAIEAVLNNSIFIASSFLPDSPLRDPADKIIAATAREFDYTVLTSDRLLLDYALRGHMRAMPC